MPLRGNCNDEKVEIYFSHQKKIHGQLVESEKYCSC